jgi:hypothetical protein
MRKELGSVRKESRSETVVKEFAEGKEAKGGNEAEGGKEAE